MKKFITAFILLILTATSSVYAQGTKIDGNQIKTETIKDINISPSAAILFSKINFTGISPSVVSAESPLTFLSPLSRTGNTISMNAIQVPAGGSGLDAVPAGRLLFGGSSTTLGTSPNLYFDNTNFRLLINAPAGTHTLEVGGTGLFTLGLIANNSSNSVSAGLNINNTASSAFGAMILSSATTNPALLIQNDTSGIAIRANNRIEAPEFGFSHVVTTTPGGFDVMGSWGYLTPTADGVFALKDSTRALDGDLTVGNFTVTGTCTGCGGGGVSLQTTPGTPDTGGFNVSTDGYIGKTLFIGDGTQLPPVIADNSPTYLQLGNKVGAAPTEHYYIRANTADSTILAGSDSFWGIHLLFRNNNPATALNTSEGGYFETSTQGDVTTQIGVVGVVALDGTGGTQAATSVYGGFFRPVTESTSVKTISDIAGTFNLLDLFSGTNIIGTASGVMSSLNFAGAAANTINTAFNYRTNNNFDENTTIDQMYGFYYVHPLLGTVNNEHAVHVENLGAGATKYAFFDEGGRVFFNGDTHQVGALLVGPLDPPATPVVTPQGAGGGVTWTYVVVATLDSGAHTAASSAGSTSTGNDTLDGTNFNRITWGSLPGASSYDVYRTVAGTTPATTGFIGSTTDLVLDDKALAGDSNVAPTLNTTGVVTSKWFATTVGTPIGDAATIAPDGAIVHITGTGTPITGIVPPFANFVGSITLIADDGSGFTTGTGGNIALGSTVIQNKALILVYDGSNWYPIY